MKTLEEAIGCWTVTEEYNSLPRLVRKCLETANDCKRITARNGRPDLLKRDLTVLRARLQTTLELTEDALRRIDQIIETGELQ